MIKNNPKLKEIVRYLIVGVLTTVVSLGIYYGLVCTILDPNQPILLQLANVLSWIGAVIFAYITNRKFVFHSKNENKLKEVSSFVGSRILTLLMDMALMFIGVSWLKFNDKLVKLFSQIVITILNYVFSKLFVFRHSNEKIEKQKKKSRYLSSYFLYLWPFLDFLLYLFGEQWYVKYFIIGIKSLFLIRFIIGIYARKNNSWLLSVLLGYGLIYLTYLYCQNFDVFKGYQFLLEIFTLPIAFFYFSKCDNFRLNEDFLFTISSLYFLLFLIPFALKVNLDYAFYNTVIAILLFLLPFTVKALYEHKNYITKILGFFIILLAVFLWHSKVLALGFLVSVFYIIFVTKRELKILIPIIFLGFCGLFYTFSADISVLQNQDYESFFFDDRIVVFESNRNMFSHANIEEQLFGIYSISEVESNIVRIDIPDIFYGLGYIGFVVYLFVLVVVFYQLKIKTIYLVGLFLSLIMSVFCGGVFVNSSLGLLFGLTTCVSKKKVKQKILLVSNMYPSKKYKHYGSFVKNCQEMLEELGFQVDIVVKKKNVLFIAKFLNYSIMYIKAIFKSIFYSYDYYYVHFVAQSTYCVLLGTWTGKTKLICNVHGNDIVADYDFEIKNVKRAQFVLSFADKIVCPSSYFEDVLINEYHIKKDNIVIFPSGGVNLDLFRPLNKEECFKELGLDDKITYYGMVSRIEKNKGWDTLLKAIYELKKQNILDNVKLLVIGTGVEQNEFDNMVSKYRLNDIIIQREFVLQKDLVKYYNCMDLFVFPTKRKSESLGLVGLEAMACGTFVIGCDLYGPREYLKNNLNSLTFQDEKELTNKILEYQKMTGKRKDKIKKQAFDTVKEYDVKQLKKKLYAIFSQK